MSTRRDPLVTPPAPPGFPLLWYRVAQVLGQSPQGITYLCQDLMFKNVVVLKEYAPVEFVQRGADGKLCLRSESSRSEFNRGLERFLSEAEDLDGFTHPNVTSVINLFEVNNTAYAAMSYAEGEDLQTVFARDPALEQADLGRVFEPILDGVEKLHERGFLHSRIRSEHIVVRKDKRGVLLDLFSIRGAVQDPMFAGELTAAGFGIDISDLGRLFYTAVAGSLPGDQMTLSAGHYEPVAKRARRHYSKELLEAIDHALAPTPEARPPTIRAWRRELGLEQPSAPLSPMPESWPAEFPRLESIAGEPSRSAIGETIGLEAPLGNEPFTDATRDVVGDVVGWRRIRPMCGKRPVLGMVMVTGIGLIAYFSGFRDSSRWKLTESTDISVTQTTNLPGAETIGKAAAILAKAPPPSIGQRQTEMAPEENRGVGVSERSNPGTPLGQMPANLGYADLSGSQVAEIPQGNAPLDRQDRRPGSEPPHVEADTAEHSEQAVPPLFGILERTLAQRRAAYIEALLRQAEEDIAALRLTRPRGQSALDKYREVFALAPENPHSARGIRAIVSNYVELAYASIRSNRPDRANRYLDRAASIAPDAKSIQRARLASAPRREASLTARGRAARTDGRDDPRESNSAMPVLRDEGSKSKPAPAKFEEFLMRIGKR